jgi:MFS family permease
VSTKVSPQPSPALTPETAARTYRYEWYVVIVCMIAYIFSFIDRQVLNLMIEPIKADLHITDTQFSLLTGLAFSLFYAIMGLPIAALADRRSRPLIISIGIAVWCLATTATGLAKNFFHIFLARVGVGAGEAALSPAAYSMFADMFPKNKLGRAVSLYSLGSFLGGALAFLIGGYVIGAVSKMGDLHLPVLGDVAGWQLTFILVGIPGILVSLLIMLTVRDPKRKGLKVGVDGKVQKVSMRNVFKFMASHPKTFLTHMFGFSFYAMTLLCLMSWSPAFFQRKFGMSPTETGYTLGIIIIVANGAGVLFGGWFVDYLSKKGYKDAPMRQGVIGAAAMTIPVFAFSFVDDKAWTIILLAIAMFFASFPMPSSTAAMQILSPNQMRAQVSAIFLLVSNLAGVALGTWLIAVVTDSVFKDPTMVGHSMSIVLGIGSIVTVFLLWPGCRFFRDSLAREQAHQTANAK